MTEYQVDVAIIGAGTAGLNAHREVTKQGHSALLIEGGIPGTTCARVGCMPSKLLIAPAKIAYRASQAAYMGVDANIEIDGPTIMHRLQQQRDRFVGGVLDTMEKLDKQGDILRGTAKFIDRGILKVGEDTVRADACVLAVGSRPLIPPPYQELGHAVLTNEQIFELDDIPESVLVVGAGVIGLELGQALHRLGSRTTIVSLGGGLASLSDEKMVEQGTRIFAEELDLHTHHELHTVERLDNGYIRAVFTDSTGNKRDEEFQYVLMAAGRRSNLDRLNLDMYNVDLTQGGGVHVDEHTLQIEGTPLFVPGDANGARPLLHEASDEGRIAGKNAITHPATRAFPRRTSLSIIFTDPNIAVVGKTFEQHDCTHHSVGEIDYNNQGRAVVEGVNRGLVRVYGESHSGRITGAEMIGPSVEHMAHLLAWAVQARLTVEQALDMPVYHPVVEEGLRTALRRLHKSMNKPRRTELCEEFSPGD